MSWRPLMEPAPGAPRGHGGGEALLGELETLVQDVVRTSSWWERHGVDCAILALSLLSVPAGEEHRTGGQRAALRLGKGVRGRVGERLGTGAWGTWPVPGTPEGGVHPRSESLIAVTCPVSPENGALEEGEGLMA